MIRFLCSRETEKKHFELELESSKQAIEAIQITRGLDHPFFIEILPVFQKSIKTLLTLRCNGVKVKSFYDAASGDFAFEMLQGGERTVKNVS